MQSKLFSFALFRFFLLARPSINEMNHSTSCSSCINCAISNVVTFSLSTQVLDLRGNPLTSVLRYREHVIGSCCYLNLVDGKAIDARSRLMMVNLHKMRVRKESSSQDSSNSAKSGGGGISNDHSTKSDMEATGCNIPNPTFDISCEEDEEEDLLDVASSSNPGDLSSRSSTDQPNNNQINPSELNFKNER